MKTFCSIAIFGIMFTVCMGAYTPEQRHEFETKILGECKGPSQATEDDVKRLIEHELPTTRTGKCLLSCTQKAFGVVVDGKPSIEGLKTIAAKKYEGNDKNIATAGEIASECGSVTDPDECELAFKLMQCLVNAAVKRGIDPKKEIQN